MQPDDDYRLPRTYRADRGRSVPALIIEAIRIKNKGTTDSNGRRLATIKTEEIYPEVEKLMRPKALLDMKKWAYFLGIDPAVMIEDWMVRNQDIIATQTGLKLGIDDTNRARKLQRLKPEPYPANYLW